MTDGHARWLVLLHRLPPTPPYLRAKILRRLGQIGAVAVKRSAYVLPANDQCFEDLQWIVREIREGGGDAWSLRASFVSGLRDEGLEETFNAARNKDYDELAEQAVKLLDAVRGAAGSAALPPAFRSEWTRLRKRMAAVRRIDFFGAPRASEVKALMTEIERALAGSRKARSSKSSSRERFRSRIWVTRRGIEEDRMASAWLIRRFIDPTARFRFVDPDSYAPAGEEVPFDMYDGEFTHEEGSCTFQVMLERFRLEDPALRIMGEIIHEIDLKDDRYGRPETLGVSLAIEGIVRRRDDDDERLRDACLLFDALHATLLAAQSH